nr:TetR/AcrR family transcriptional regulator [Glycomyces sp. L485]
MAAAARRFAAAGFHRTSMQDVIEEAGLSPGAVYRYFRSKDELIEAISIEAMAHIESVVRGALAADESLADLVSGLPGAFESLGRTDERSRLAVQAWSEGLRNADLAEAMRAGMAAVRSALSDRIARDRSRTDADPDDVAGVLLGLLQGYLLQKAWDPGLDPARYGRAAAELIRR